MPTHDEEAGPSPLEAPVRPLPPLTWRDRITDLTAAAAGRPVVAASAVAALAVAALLLVPLAQHLGAEPSGRPVEAVLPMAETSGPAPASAAVVDASSGVAGPDAGGVTTGVLVVHAAGAVLRPGVHELAPGSRVDDLVAAAGGLAPEADVDRVNLALPLVDGERVYVPAVGQEEVPPAPGPGGGGGGGGAPGAPGALVDLNSADQSQLEELPGVGPVTAQAIIAHREEQGPFTSVDGLLAVRGIGDARLAQLRELVTV